MKKIISVFMLMVMLSLSIMPVFADVVAVDTENVDISQNSSNFYCEFNSEKNIIEISGTINHDILVKYGNYTICIYKIPFNTTYETAIKNIDNQVISHAPISIKFEYVVQISAIEDRFAKYALVLSSPTGDTYLASHMKMPAVYGEAENIDKSGFKGIETNNIAHASNHLPGTAIVTVDLDSLYGNASNCYLYPMGDTFAYIDKGVISDLDSQIMTLSQTGSNIYLRFLVLAKGNINSLDVDIDHTETPYTIPDIYDAQTLDFICAASSFIAERYNGSERGYINGVVLGTRADDVKETNYIQNLTFDKYIEKYVIYMLSVANSMRSINPAINLVVPISDANAYTAEAEATAKGAEFIEGILTNLEDHFLDDPLFSIMLEIEDAPFGISNATLDRIIDTSTLKEEYDRISVENIEIFANYFSRLSDRFENAPQSYSILWKMPQDLSGNALSCAYAYSYYKLFDMDSLSSFIISFADDHSDGECRFDELSNIFRYIDTEDTFEVTDNLLKYFGVVSWSKILRTKSASAYAARTYYEIELLDTLPKDVKGSFDYFNFSSSTSVNNWKNGVNTKSAKAEYSANGVRALHVHSHELKRGDTFEIYYTYDTVENFSYTPYLVFDMNIDALDTNAVFEVSVMLGNGDVVTHASKAFTSGEHGQMILDIYEFNEENNAQYLKISIRALTDDSESVSIWLNSIKGYSTEYDDEDLEGVIEMERLRTKGESDTADERGMGATVVTIILVIITIVAVGVVLFVLFKKEDDI